MYLYLLSFSVVIPTRSILDTQQTSDGNDIEKPNFVYKKDSQKTKGFDNKLSRFAISRKHSYSHAQYPNNIAVRQYGQPTQLLNT
jgi:hypothetical protein